MSTDVLEKVVDQYTRESGVRTLDKMISKMIRNVAKSIAMDEQFENSPTSNTIEKVLGAPKFDRDRFTNNSVAGVVTGLAWTSVGGDLLHIEALKLPGKGRMKTTGKLGDVMKESIDAANSYVRSISKDVGIKPPIFDKTDIHVHVPEGATPKDGPSAGIGMVTSIVSSLTNIPVKKEVAMTGEVTITGQVLPIGGLKEKSTAAHRAGLKHIIAPFLNEKDLEEIPSQVKKDLKITFVKDVGDVIKLALGD